MAKSQQSFNKAEKEKKKAKKKKDKLARKEERKANATGGNLDDMMAYVDEFGKITDTPPDPTKKKEKIIAENIVIGVAKQEDVYIDPIRKGRVDFFNEGKGFGFIKETGTGESFFVHINGCEYQIGEGDMVSFELEKGMKGMNAVRVKKQ